MAGRKLSKSSITTLRRALSDVENLKAQIRQGSESGSVVRNSSPHYIVETPVDGIPAASGSPLQPGSAVCKIYWREGSPRTLQNTNRDQTVYNYQTTTVPGSRLVLAHKDGWGDLWIDGSGVSCSTLAPGSYRAICGATIAPGGTGAIQVTDCNGETQTTEATNHTNCTFYTGERITAHITPCCTAHFDGCSCCGDAPACCDRSVAVCVGGVSAIIAVDGGTYTWDVAGCTGCEGATLEIELACTSDPLDITATWTYTCGESTETGTLDWDGLCSDPATEYEDVIIVESGVIPVLATASLESCSPCDLPEQPCEACTAGTVTVGATSFSTVITNIESSTLSISTTALETDTIFTITAVLSMVGSADTETGKFAIGSTGSTCLYASPDSNKSGLEGPPVISNGAGCAGAGGVEWDLALITEESITCTAVFRFNGCTTNLITFFWDSDFVGADQLITWSVTCGECGGGGPGGEGGGI